MGINYYQTYDFIRDFTAKPMSTKEAVLGCAAKDAMDVSFTCAEQMLYARGVGCQGGCLQAVSTKGAV